MTKNSKTLLPQKEVLDAWNHGFEILREHNSIMGQALSQMMQGQVGPQMLSPASFGDALLKTSQSLLEHPEKLLEAQQNLLTQVFELWEDTFQKAKDAATEIQSSRDKRFKSDIWKTNPYFHFSKEYYLLTSQWVQDLVGEAEGLSPDDAQKARFALKQMTDALSPTNFPFSNPEVIQKTIETGGENLKQGYEHLMSDMMRGVGVSTTDINAFVLGKTIATTPGDVIFRNDYLELIHYKPLVREIYQAPILIIPPWINKFYIFDLSPSNSFVKWMLSQGLDVFIISWVNPGMDMAEKSFADYMIHGVLEAMKTIVKNRVSPDIHLMGYCIGGVLTLCLLGYLAKKKEPLHVVSATLLATIFDFSKIGDLRVFLDKTQIDAAEELMKSKGVLSGQNMNSITSLLRANEMIWSFFVKNYLMGQKPPAFDFLYWNSDATNLPATMHSFVLRSLFHDNLLMKPKSFSLGGVPIDLSLVKTPIFSLATQNDHISPWKSCYEITQVLEAPVTFVLGGSGHVAGVMNPPAQNKYEYWQNTTYSALPENWLKNAKTSQGSWWKTWDHWMENYKGEKVQLDKILKASYPQIEAAPGRYVAVSYRDVIEDQADESAPTRKQKSA
ncbi:Class I poly(R)-hydroxyalkanoic acid synthase [Candidatus Bealeia paramacronuclearis]|uniref:Class I poly(R)-hydroxyalkanoic acid synthase n=1 Tax=Candidatus Bealeia paramacronuclearis TaxID=1921001 RepID=A0ABZ2C563_9PROT